MAAASDAKTDQKTQMESMGSMYSVFKKHTNVPWYLIDPRYSNRLAAWDGLNALALIFTALVTPFEVAFMPPERRAASVRFVLNRAIDIFFLFDMIIQLFIMYPQEKAVKVDPKKQTSSAMKEMLQPKSHVEMVMSQRKIAADAAVLHVATRKQEVGEKLATTLRAGSSLTSSRCSPASSTFSPSSKPKMSALLRWPSP